MKTHSRNQIIERAPQLVKFGIKMGLIKPPDRQMTDSNIMYELFKKTCDRKRRAR